MTTSMAAGWWFVIGGFTGLVGMQLVIVRGSRSPRGACPQRAQREAAEAQLDGLVAQGASLVPGPGGPVVGAQRVAREKVAPTA